MPGLSLHIPQGHRIPLRLMGKPRHPGNALGNLALGISSCAQAAKIAFDVCGEHGDSGIAEDFRQTLQRHRLSGARSARNQPMTIGQTQRLTDRLTIEARTNENLLRVRHVVTQKLRYFFNSMAEPVEPSVQAAEIASPSQPLHSSSSQDCATAMGALPTHDRPNIYS
jgi:hypothetical protein